MISHYLNLNQLPVVDRIRKICNIYMFRIFLLRYQLFTPNQGINLEGIQRIGKQARAVFLPIIMVSEIMYKKEQH